ncbi:AMP-binding protein [Pseudomonas sp. 5P_3.1_Bac2]|uniref:AMP-binding protein n=1 Tax=Pseudomonas sp. 5P_3.1_Bac2 TaxID=2971617 RepID=UPI0021C9B9E8|nr:AMP-binding protein [Pseudomonas sp. 5P_3.1_Bac2]MCU1716237.1 AMP-binding protein [Pseudomonas sp. 5P_3.1_Bac2]
MSELLPLQRFTQWVETRADKVWLSQPVDGKWHDLTWAEVDDQVRRMASALRALGCVPGDRVALLSKNCAQWIIADLAIMAAGLVSVPLYPLQSAQSIEYVLTHSAAKAIFLGKLDEADKLVAGIPEQVIRIAMPYPTLPSQYAWDALLAAHQPLAQVHQQQPDGLLSILYTSGTTGQPKGVMLSAQAFAWAGTQSVRELKITEHEQYFSYLPLSHAAERVLVEVSALYSGGRIAFVESLATFAIDLKHVRPTIFFSVPRLWTRFQQGVLEKLPQAKLQRLLRLPLIGKLVARKIRQGLGLDRARFLVSGAAPIPRSLVQWYAQIGMPICEGYGMTEHLAYGCFNRPGAQRVGTVGKPMPGLELRLGEDGEILLRCPSLMQGYYLDPEQTAQTIRDGWLHTGDLGQVDADGFVSITGRVKDIFKTSKGKYIAPAPIEGAIAKNLLVEQVCLLGSHLNQPMALLELTPAARELPRAQVEASLLATLEALNADLLPNERVSHMLLVREPWTVDNGCMTPTMKIRRNVLEQRFAQEPGVLDSSQAVRWQE